jgi:hypothetical protein
MERPLFCTLPFGRSTREYIPDPFLEREITPDRHELYHSKLPEFHTSVDQRILNRRAQEQGFPKEWDLSISNLPLQTLEHYGDSSFGWHYTQLKDNDFIVTRYWASLSPDWWWSEDAPWLTITGDKWHVFVNDNGSIMVSSSTGHTYERRTNRFLDPSLADDVWVRSEVYNNLPNEWDPPSYYGEVGAWLDLTGSQSYPPMATLFEEPQRFLKNSTAKHQWEFEWLQQHAFYDACEDIAKANDNMIQNLVGMAEFLWDIAKGNFARQIDDILDDIDPRIQVRKITKHKGREISLMYSQDELLDQFIAERLNVSTAGSWWMTHRYQIQTAKMDLSEFQKYLLAKADQFRNFLNSQYHQVSYGYASREVDGVKVECHCKIAWRPRVLQGFDAVFEKLHEWGLEINPYVLWDMLPGSFVADWFLPLGDVFQVDSDAPYLTDQYYDFTECSFSTRYSMEGVNNDVGSRYYRWYSDPPLLDGTYWFDKGSAKTSGKTFFKRVLDSGAIASGILISR